MMIAQYIVNFLLLGLLLLVFFVFFAKQKSFRLLVIYLSIFAVYAGVYIVDWLYAEIDFSLAVAIMQLVAIFALIALLVVYQAEFKTLFFNLTKKQSGHEIEVSDDDLRTAINEIVKSCQTMSKARTGALIVLVPTKITGHILETGTDINGLVTSPLLESIFNTKAPIHDGAVIIRGNQILAAGCFLPLSQAQNLPKDIGTRHRAGIGITEESDVVSIIVSEENGIISVAQGGALKRYITPEKLSDMLSELYGIVRVPKKKAIK